MVSKDEAVHAMDNALVKACSSESKLQEVMVFISKTNELKEATIGFMFPYTMKQRNGKCYTIL
jgi:hypothetical protein